MKPSLQQTVIIISACITLCHACICPFPVLCPQPQSPPETCKCGVANRATRIIGGSETEVNEYPWQVRLVYPGYPGSDGKTCGGSIISAQHILTAAKCTQGNLTSYLQVSLGEHDTTDAAADIRTVSRITNHPQYNPDNLLNDISILTLSSPLTFSRAMSPVCLPADPSLSYAGDTATVTGWGRTSPDPEGPLADSLQEVELTVLSNEDCRNSFSDATKPIEE